MGPEPTAFLEGTGAAGIVCVPLPAPRLMRWPLPAGFTIVAGAFATDGFTAGLVIWMGGAMGLATRTRGTLGFIIRTEGTAARWSGATGRIFCMLGMLRGRRSAVCMAGIFTLGALGRPAMALWTLRAMVSRSRQMGFVFMT